MVKVLVIFSELRDPKVKSDDLGGWLSGCDLYQVMHKEPGLNYWVRLAKTDGCKLGDYNWCDVWVLVVMAEYLRLLRGPILVLSHLLLLNRLLEVWGGQSLHMVDHNIIRVCWRINLNYFLNFLLAVEVRLLLLNPITKVVGPLFKLELLRLFQWHSNWRLWVSNNWLVTYGAWIKLFVWLCQVSPYFLLLRNLVWWIVVTPELFFWLGAGVIDSNVILWEIILDIRLVTVAWAHVKSEVIFLSLWAPRRNDLLVFGISIFIVSLILILDHFISESSNRCSFRVVSRWSCIELILILLWSLNHEIVLHSFSHELAAATSEMNIWAWLSIGWIHALPLHAYGPRLPICWALSANRPSFGP